MKLQELKNCTDKELSEIEFEMLKQGNIIAANGVGNFRKFYGKTVKVVKGRKVPKGTEGICFWIGQTDYSKYGDPWGIYTKYRIGFKDEKGEIYWTALDNVDVIK